MVYLEANLRKNPEGSAYSKFAEARWRRTGLFYGAASMEGSKEKPGIREDSRWWTSEILEIVPKGELLFAGLDQGEL